MARPAVVEATTVTAGAYKWVLEATADGMTHYAHARGTKPQKGEAITMEQDAHRARHDSHVRYTEKRTVLP